MIYFSDKVGEHWDCVYLDGTSWGVTTLSYRMYHSCILYLLKQKKCWGMSGERGKARKALLERLLPPVWKEQFLPVHRNTVHIKRKRLDCNVVFTPPGGGTYYTRCESGYTKIHITKLIKEEYKGAVIVEINPVD